MITFAVIWFICFIVVNLYHMSKEEESEDPDGQETEGKSILSQLGSSFLIAIPVSIFYWLFVLSLKFGSIVWFLFLGIIIFGIVKFFIVLLGLGGAAIAVSSTRGNSSSADNVTYGLQRASGAVWYTIAQGPENWMINKMEQNRAKDNARYRVVKLVNGKLSGTSYS